MIVAVWRSMAGRGCPIRWPWSPAACLAAALAGLLLAGCQGELPVSAALQRAAERAHDPQQLRRSLEAIEAWHVANRTGVAEALQPGLPADTLTAGLADLGCGDSEELRTLWSWRNGESADAPFTWYHDLLSLDEARTERRWMWLNVWAPATRRFVPVVGFQGELFAVRCAEGAVAGPVAHLDPEDDPKVTHVNLTTFMAGVAEALQSGAVRWHDGAMVEDAGALLRIHGKHNPGYPYPYAVP